MTGLDERRRRPSALAAAETVQRVVGMGFCPHLDHERRHAFHIGSESKTVDRPHHRYLVSIEAEGETIGVQEVKRDR